MSKYKYIDGFYEAEYSGRTFFSQCLDSNKVVDKKFTETKYDSVDVFWSTSATTNVGEIKFRIGYKSTDKIMQSEGAILEKSKYDALKSYQHNSGITPYYIMMYNDGEGYIWDLSNLERVEWQDDKRFPKTTMGTNNQKVEKAVTYLNLDDAKKFKFQM